MNRPHARTNPCRAAGTKVVSRWNGGGARWSRTWKCPVCGRDVPVNYNGTLRWHKAEVKR